MIILTASHATPKSAGKAKIEFFEPKQNYYNGPNWIPTREKEEIRLPVRTDAEFYSLRKGQQFIFRLAQANEVYFGGTDEEPFLVRLDPTVFGYFRQGGEGAFFGALVPELVSDTCDKFGQKYRRQGDIFAVPVPMTWKSLRQATTLISDEAPVEVQDANRRSIFKTRHLFTGHAMEGKLVKSLGLFVEGLIEAPDHEPLELKRIFLLSQTRYLFDPKNAD